MSVYQLRCLKSENVNDAFYSKLDVFIVVTNFSK